MELPSVSGIKASFYVNELCKKSDDFKKFVDFLYELDKLVNQCNNWLEECKLMKAIKLETKRLIANEVAIYCETFNWEYIFSLTGICSDKLLELFLEFEDNTENLSMFHTEIRTEMYEAA